MSSLTSNAFSISNTLQFSPDQFVQWFREIAPYIHIFKGKTFVIAFSGELIQIGALNALVQDLSLLSSLGIHILLVHGLLPQVNKLFERGEDAPRTMQSRWLDRC